MPIVLSLVAIRSPVGGSKGRKASCPISADKPVRPFFIDRSPSLVEIPSLLPNERYLSKGKGLQTVQRVSSHLASFSSESDVRKRILGQASSQKEQDLDLTRASVTMRVERLKRVDLAVKVNKFTQLALELEAFLNPKVK